MTQIQFEEEYRNSNHSRYIVPKYIKEVNGEKTLFFFCVGAWHSSLIGNDWMPLRKFYQRYQLC